VKEAYKVLRIISARCKGGLAAKLDVYQAKARFENERYNLAQAEGDLEGAKADLTKAMGVSAFSVFTITRPEKEFAVTLDQEIVTRLISQGLEKRQDIAALRASVIQREYAVKAARSKLWPSLNLEGLGDYSRYNSYHKPINEILTNKYTSTMNTSIGVSLQWDVFDGFSNYYNKVAAEKDLEAERQKLKQLEIEAGAGVWSSYYAVKASSEGFQYSTELVKQNKKVYSMIKKGYTAGVYNILDLVYTQRDLFNSQLQNIDCRNKWYVSLAELTYEIGAFSVDKNTNRRIHVRK
jgi:outer membrane protein